jgi:hypothetical protein
MAGNGTVDRNDALVAPFMRVVANGVRGGKLQVTLIVTPQKVPTGTLQLADWPSAIAGFLNPRGHSISPGVSATFPLRISFQDPTDVGHARFKTVQASFRAPPVESVEVVRLWRSAIEGDGSLATPWSALRDDIDRSMSGEKHEAKLAPQYAGSTDLPGSDYFTDAGAMVAPPYDPMQKSTVKGVVANTQAQFATETEAAPAQRIATKLVVGPYLPGDQDEETNSETQDGDTGAKKAESDVLYTGSIAAGPGSIQARLTAARRQQLFERLKSSIQATTPSRARSNDSFNAVQRYLDPTMPAAQATAPAAAAPSIIAPRIQVLGGSTTKDRASHIYGAWTQRSSAAPRNSTDACPAPDPVAQLHGVYYSLQGDPILSRFFGFVFDLEFQPPADIAPNPEPMVDPGTRDGADMDQGCVPSVWIRRVFLASIPL